MVVFVCLFFTRELLSWRWLYKGVTSHDSQVSGSQFSLEGLTLHGGSYFSWKSLSWESLYKAFTLHEPFLLGGNYFTWRESLYPESVYIGYLPGTHLHGRRQLSWESLYLGITFMGLFTLPESYIN